MLYLFERILLCWNSVGASKKISRPIACRDCALTDHPVQDARTLSTLSKRCLSFLVASTKKYKFWCNFVLAIIFYRFKTHVYFCQNTSCSICRVDCWGWLFALLRITTLNRTRRSGVAEFARKGNAETQHRYLNVKLQSSEGARIKDPMVSAHKNVCARLGKNLRSCARSHERRVRQLL